MLKKLRSRIENARSRIEGKRRIRRLSLSKSGQWYVILSISIGVVALTSGNNVIYLIESLLLAGLILSGVLAEKTVSGARLAFSRGQAIAGEKCPDWIRVENTGRLPLFCLEIGEWVDGEFVSSAFVPRIAPRTALLVAVDQVIPRRGPHRWQGFALATSYPFGFARKTKIVRIPGERLVWPERSADRKRGESAEQASRMGRSIHQEIAEGEIRPYEPWSDDARMIVAHASLKGQGPLVRNRRSAAGDAEVALDLNATSSEVFERAVRQAASPFHETHQPTGGRLVITRGRSRETVFGKQGALDRLARIEFERADGEGDPG